MGERTHPGQHPAGPPLPTTPPPPPPPPPPRPADQQTLFLVLVAQLWFGWVRILFWERNSFLADIVSNLALVLVITTQLAQQSYTLLDLVSLDGAGCIKILGLI